MFEIVRKLFNFSKNKQELEILENKIKKLRNKEYDIRQTIEELQKGHTFFECAFSPEDNCEKVILNALDEAKKSIRLIMYEFNNEKIMRKIIQRWNDGIQIEIILDGNIVETTKNGCSKYQDIYQKLLANEIPVQLDNAFDYEYACQHNKVMIIDDKTIITGSYNFTINAERNNCENLLAFHNCTSLAEKYIKVFDKRWQKLSHLNK